jgi:polyhydroxyalkanoate synthesis regulator phasin
VFGLAEQGKNEMLRTALLLGLGAASITAEAIEEAVSELRKQGDIDEDQARALLKGLVARQKEKARQFGARQVALLQSKNPLVTRAEFARLEARVKKLEAGGGKKRKR